MRKLYFFVAGWLGICQPLLAQFPTLTTCNFESSASSVPISAAKTSSFSFQLVPSAAPLNIYFGQNASASASGTNEFEVGGVNILNNTGSDVGNVLIALKGLGFWTQNIASTPFQYFTWNQAMQRWEGTLGSGQQARFGILDVIVNGVSYTTYDINLMPVQATAGASGYHLADFDPAMSASFTDGGTGTVYTASASLAMPAMVPVLNLGYLGNGQSITDVRIRIGLQIDGNADAWVNYNADAGAGDYDYYVQAETVLMGTVYDHGDAPVSYGDAGHGPVLCGPSTYLGATRPDYEVAVAGSASTDADDTNTAGYDDEDIVFPDYIAGNTTYTVSVPYVNNLTGGQSNAWVMAWVDWDNDGSFSDSERASVLVGPGSSAATLLWTTAPGNFDGTLPASVSPGTKTVRVRIGQAFKFMETGTGLVQGGEVEDLKLTVTPSSLPVRLMSFSGVADGENTVQLSWTTASEQNNRGFDVMRSYDGRAWETLGFVTSRADGGFSTGKLTYQYRDGQVLQPVAYYRLRQVDLDGKSENSPVISVETANGAQYLTAPNPTTDAVRISRLHGGEKIVVADVHGRVVWSSVAQKETETVRLGNQPAGMYVIGIETIGGIRRSFRVVRQ